MTDKRESGTPKFVYLLNAMENAAAQENPSKHGYAGHRAKVLDYVAKIECELIEARRDGERLRACALKYLSWLGVKDGAAGLIRDAFDPEMVGSDLASPLAAPPAAMEEE